MATGLLPLVVLFGLACKYYRGRGGVWMINWVNNWGPASVAYEWLFMLLAFIVWPSRRHVIRIGVCVFVMTCVVEFLQLWKPPLLQSVRATLPGRLVLGTTFSWWDFPAYAVGCVLGVLLLRCICLLTASIREPQGMPRSYEE